MSEATRVLSHSCNKCKKRWSGVRTAHCAACCTTFSGITHFDNHRVNGRCVTPEDKGMSLLGRDYEVYGIPLAEGQEWW